MEISDKMRRMWELTRKIARRRRAEEETEKLIAAIKERIRVRLRKNAA